MIRSGFRVVGCGPAGGLTLAGAALLLLLVQPAAAVTLADALTTVRSTPGGGSVERVPVVGKGGVGGEGSGRRVRLTTGGDGGPVVDPPSAPRTLAAEPGDEQVKLSWTPPASDGGGTIARYEYRHAAFSDTLPTNWTHVTGGAGAREVTVEQLTNGTTHRFQVRAVNEAGGGRAATTTATPVDPDATPELSVPDLTVGEGDGTVVVRVALAPPASDTVTVSYETSDRGAIAGEDYGAANGKLTFTPGTTAREIRVTITNDRDEEGDEDFAVTLSDAEGAGIGRAEGVVTIQDDDLEPTFDVPSAPRSLAALEGDEEITLTWSPPADDGGKPVVRYEYRFAKGSDEFPDSWTAVSGGPAARRVKIGGLENDVAHRFQLHAVNEIGEGDAARERGTPTDDDPLPSLWIDDVSVGEGSGTATLRVTLSAESGDEVTVEYETEGGERRGGRGLQRGRQHADLRSRRDLRGDRRVDHGRRRRGGERDLHGESWRPRGRGDRRRHGPGDDPRQRR